MNQKNSKSYDEIAKIIRERRNRKLRDIMAVNERDFSIIFGKRNNFKVGAS